MKFEGTLPKSKNIIVPKFNNGHWSFPEQMGNGVGFIYVIKDLALERFYLGKSYMLGWVN